MTGIPDSVKARMVMLSGLNWSNVEIANELGVSESTVSDYLNKYEDESKAADSWESVYWKTIQPAIFDSELFEKVAGMLSTN